MPKPRTPVWPALAAALDDLRARVVINDAAARHGIDLRMLRFYAEREGVSWKNRRSWRRDDPVVIAAVEAIRRGEPVEVVARRVGVAERTLRRWYGNAGVNFSKAVNRRTVALVMAELEAGTTTRDEIAARLKVRRPTVDRWATDRGLHEKTGRKPGRIETMPVGNAAKVLRLHAQHAPLRAIAVAIDRHVETVRSHLKRWLPRVAQSETEARAA